jgi:hypothetical protein
MVFGRTNPECTTPPLAKEPLTPMSTQTVAPRIELPAQPAPREAAQLPTTPSSVVWSNGHAYVLERMLGRPRWHGMDDRGRPQALSCADLQRRGWSRTR